MSADQVQREAILLIATNLANADTHLVRSLQGVESALMEQTRRIETALERVSYMLLLITINLAVLLVVIGVAVAR